MMIKFEKPINLNGAELINELISAGIIINTETSPFLDGNGDFWLDIAESDTAIATSIVASHNGTTIVPDKSAAKAALLERLGITEEEAKLLLS